MNDTLMSIAATSIVVIFAIVFFVCVLVGNRIWSWL
jgi:uncharacterized membrane-anchored protein YjiN (DUF445 family)